MYVWTEERVTYLRAHYRAGIKGVPKAIAAHLGWPDWVIKRKATELGLTASERYNRGRREWTGQDEAFLIKYLGRRTAHWIAKKLDRTLVSVVMKAKKLHLSVALREGYTVRRLCLCFGVDHKVVDRWLDDGKLRRRERPYKGRRALCVNNVDVLEFIQEHPGAFELSRVDQAWFMDLIVGAGILRRAIWRESAAAPAVKAKRRVA
jgi:hypothetical protein